jgi:hypothetical protein
VVDRDPSVGSAAAIMGDIQRTLADFHSDCALWEQEMEGLADELMQLAGSGGPLPRDGRPRSGPEHDQLVTQQMRMAVELSELRRLVEQQHRTLRDAPGHETPPARPAAADASEDPIIEQVLTRLRELQQSSRS